MTTDKDAHQRMRGYIQLVATGPELSKSLDRHSADDAMTLILQGEIDPVRAGIFLIALRMKRETEAENLGVLDAIDRITTKASTQAPQVMAIADPFNGYLRGIPATPFLPAVLAACGLPAYLHGVATAGPKYGLTAPMILRAAGKSVDQSVVAAAGQLDQESAGWAYLDQSRYSAQLHNLVDLRDAMVKRCCISTIEVVLKPISGATRTHLMTGFVHKAYPPVYCDLARHAGFYSSVIVRGVEGGCIPSLSQLSRYFGYVGDGEMDLFRLAPEELSIEQNGRSISIPDQFLPLLETTSLQNKSALVPVAEYAAELGLQALSTQPGPMRDSLVYATAIALCHTGLAPTLADGAGMGRAAIDSGEALARFNAAA